MSLLKLDSSTSDEILELLLHLNRERETTFLLDMTPKLLGVVHELCICLTVQSSMMYVIRRRNSPVFPTRFTCDCYRTAERCFNHRYWTLETVRNAEDSVVGLRTRR